MANARVQIQGLRELRLGLRRLDRNLPRAIRVAGNESADMIVNRSRPLVPVGPAQGGHAASSIRKASTQSEVRVSEGGPRYPYMPWLDFGGTINKNTSNPTRRPFYTDGRFIWHVFGEHQAEVEQNMREALRRIALEAGLETDI